MMFIIDRNYTTRIVSRCYLAGSSVGTFAFISLGRPLPTVFVDVVVVTVVPGLVLSPVILSVLVVEIGWSSVITAVDPGFGRPIVVVRPMSLSVLTPAVMGLLFWSACCC